MMVVLPVSPEDIDNIDVPISSDIICRIITMGPQCFEMKAMSHRLKDPSYIDHPVSTGDYVKFDRKYTTNTLKSMCEDVYLVVPDFHVKQVYYRDNGVMVKKWEHEYV